MTTEMSAIVDERPRLGKETCMTDNYSGMLCCRLKEA